jgi:hypothetical protein
VLFVCLRFSYIIIFFTFFCGCLHLYILSLKLSFFCCWKVIFDFDGFLTIDIESRRVSQKLSNNNRKRWRDHFVFAMVKPKKSFVENVTRKTFFLTFSKSQSLSPRSVRLRNSFVSICLYVCMSVCVFVCLSVCLTVYLSFKLTLYDLIFIILVVFNYEATKTILYRHF